MAVSARSIARRAGDNPVLEAGARVGYAASGLLHFALAWLALQLAFGHAGDEADQTGAIRALAGTPVGVVLLWLLLAGFVLLGLWQVTEVFLRPGAQKVSPAATAVVYAVLAATTWSVLAGGSKDPNQQTESLTAAVMSHPAGPWAVGVVGLAVVGVGVYHVAKGVRASFLTKLRAHPAQWVVRIAQAGYVAKGIALGAVGALFVVAATTHDPSKAGGLDAGLRSLLKVPEGQVVLVGVAVGLAFYGIYSIVRSAYARV